MLLSDVRDRLTSKQFKWVVFDAVGTLIHPEPSVAVAYQMIGAQHGSSLTVAEASERFRRAFRRSETEFFPNRPQSDSVWLSSDAIELARWRWIVEEVLPDVDNLDQCFEELWNHFAHPASWSCFDEVGTILNALTDAGFRLAIATNFDSRLHSVCAGHPALNSIERRFVSSEIGYRKPAPQFYASLIQECGVAPNQILMIGDNFAHDVAGPLASDMAAILLDRGLTRELPDAIRSLLQLVPAGHD